MNREQIARKLLELYHIEEQTGRKCYDEICVWIGEYHSYLKESGLERDEFIKEFIRDYDCLRRQGS